MDIIDIVLKIDRSIKESKRYYLILEIAISCLKSGFSFITFSNFY